MQQYPPPNQQPPQIYVPVQPPYYIERPLNRGMKTGAIICFSFCFVFQVFALFPLIGILFGLAGLCLGIIGFVLLCMI